MLRQILIVSVLNFRSLRHRLWQSMVIVAGFCATIGVLLSIMSVTEGLEQSFFHAGGTGRAIVVSQAAQSENTSSISRTDSAIIIDAPGVAKDKDGNPLADRALSIAVAVLRKNGTQAYSILRGFGSEGAAIRPEFHMVAGRMFAPGKRELVVGVGAQAMFQHMELGDKVILPNGPWPIVGVYTTGDALDGELIGDTDTILAATKRSGYNSIVVKLATPDSLSTFSKALTTNPALQVTVMRHSDWYKRVSSQVTGLLATLALVVGVLMAIGALFGCLYTMYGAVTARAREIATLRALGYGAFPVAVSVILEAVMLATIGALMGAAIAWLLNDGKQAVYGVNIFTMRVSPALVGLGVVWALVVAFLGGLLPAIRAARLSVVDALRAI